MNVASKPAQRQFFAIKSALSEVLQLSEYYDPLSFSAIHRLDNFHRRAYENIICEQWRKSLFSAKRINSTRHSTQDAWRSLKTTMRLINRAVRSRCSFRFRQTRILCSRAIAWGIRHVNEFQTKGLAEKAG